MIILDIQWLAEILVALCNNTIYVIIKWKICPFPELGFKRRLLLFLQQNQFYLPDFRFNVSIQELSEDKIYDIYDFGSVAIKASRAKFQHNNLANTSIRIEAMNEVKEGLNSIKFNLHLNSSGDNFLQSPIAYSYIYQQWEANETISHELIRNLGLTFATIAVISLVLIMNFQVSFAKILNFSVIFTRCLLVMHIDRGFLHLIHYYWICILSTTLCKICE